MSYTPPAVSNTLFIGRLFIISVSCARNCTISGGDRLWNGRTIVIGLIDVVWSEVGRKLLATNCSLSLSLSSGDNLERERETCQRNGIICNVDQIRDIARLVIVCYLSILYPYFIFIYILYLHYIYILKRVIIFLDFFISFRDKL